MIGRIKGQEYPAIMREMEHQTRKIAIAIYISGIYGWIMSGADLIQLLSVLIEVIIVAGAVFIAAKKAETFWLGSCCHV